MRLFDRHDDSASRRRQAEAAVGSEADFERENRVASSLASVLDRRVLGWNRRRIEAVPNDLPFYGEVGGCLVEPSERASDGGEVDLAVLVGVERRDVRCCAEGDVVHVVRGGCLAGDRIDGDEYRAQARVTVVREKVPSEVAGPKA